MLHKTIHSFDIGPIIEQVLTLNITERIPLNTSIDGDLFGGTYTTLPEFVNTPLGNVLAQLGEIGEARLLPLGSIESYHAHRDPDDRYHLSIITSPYSYLANLEDNTLHHLPADGSVWLMDTSILHSAINLVGGARVHLNVRMKLPTYRGSGYKLTFNSDRYDWIQQFYITALGYVNKACKKGSISGIKKVSDNVLLLNCSMDVVNHIARELSKVNILTTVETV